MRWAGQCGEEEGTGTGNWQVETGLKNSDQASRPRSAFSSFLSTHWLHLTFFNNLTFLVKNKTFTIWAKKRTIEDEETM